MKTKDNVNFTCYFFMFPYLFDFSFQAEDHKTNALFQYFIYTEKNKILTRFFLFLVESINE